MENRKDLVKMNVLTFIPIIILSIESCQSIISSCHSLQFILDDEQQVDVTIRFGKLCVLKNDKTQNVLFLARKNITQLFDTCRERDIILEEIDWSTCNDELVKSVERHVVSLRERLYKEMASTVCRWKVVLAILTLVLLILSIIIVLVRNATATSQRYVDVLVSRTQDLRREKLKSDQLLSQMLPPIVVKQLVHQRKVLAENFDSVTIFFSDIVGYTNLSASSTPMEILNTLDTLYKLYDLRIQRYDVYKVETIGDSYMVVGGLVRERGLKHAGEVARMSLDLLESTRTFVIPHRPREKMEIRIGISTGQCAAGVVGTTMPRYCFFGDTINTASRMESTGEAMKIHISQSTRDALESLGGYETEFRGIMEVKGKGAMNTYWLLRKERSSMNLQKDLD